MHEVLTYVMHLESGCMEKVVCERTQAWNTTTIDRSDRGEKEKVLHDCA